MTSILNPYISFKDTAREAITFYHTVFGGKVSISTFGEAGMTEEQGPKDGVMHAQLVADNGINIMMSDAPIGMPLDTGSNVSLSLSGNNEAELKGYWDKLSEGATISVPLAPSSWGDLFGMLTDKFGVQWLVNIAPQK